MLGRPGAKLGFTRLSFNYFISEAVFEYLVEAVHLLANEGWKLLPLYRFDAATGLWHHASARPAAAADPRRPVGRRAAPDRARERRSRGSSSEARRIIGAIDSPAPCPGRPDRFRWFPLPDEVAVSA